MLRNHNRQPQPNPIQRSLEQLQLKKSYRTTLLRLKRSHTILRSPKLKLQRSHTPFQPPLLRLKRSHTHSSLLPAL